MKVKKYSLFKLMCGVLKEINTGWKNIFISNFFLSITLDISGDLIWIPVNPTWDRHPNVREKLSPCLM